MITTATATISHVDTTIGPELFRKSVPFLVETHSFGEHRQASMSRVEFTTDTEEVKPDTAWTSLTKRLLNMPELSAIRAHDARFRTFLKREAATPMKRGFWLVPSLLVTRVDARATAWELRREELVREAVLKYRDTVAEAEQKLGVLFDPNDYPPVERFAAAFWVRWRFMDIGTPNVLRELSVDVFRREMAKVEAEAREAEAAIREHLRVVLLEITTHLGELLTPKADGKYRTLRDNALDEVLRFLDTAALRNITNDQQLQSFVLTLKGLGNGLDVHALRDDKNLRTRTAAAVTAVKDALEPLIDARSRGIRMRD